MLTAPPISKDLIDYLEKVYSPALFRVRTDADPHQVAATIHQESGRHSVIDHLRAVFEQQQTQDPLNVHEDPEGS